MIRLGIIEDEATVRQSLVDFFKSIQGVSVQLDAGSVETFWEKWAEDCYFDIILSDIGLPGMSGIEGVFKIKNKAPDCDVVMLSVYNDAHHVFQALRAGATGYISKQSSFNKIKDAVFTVFDGGSYMSPQIARKVTDFFNAKRITKGQKESLTEREEQVLHLIEEGYTNKKIGAELFISPETVKSHVKSIYRKLEVNSRKDLMKRYR